MGFCDELIMMMMTMMMTKGDKRIGSLFRSIMVLTGSMEKEPWRCF